MSDLDRQQDLLQGIGQALFDELPDDFTSARVVCSMIGFQARFVCSYTRASGAESTIGMPDDLYELFLDLRDATYEPGKGAWYTAEFVVDGDGRFSIDFDYDNRPAVVSATEDDYFDDLEKYPRAPELIPDWYPRPA
ncbi:immunity protein YezG family protein [Actinopolymorpha alba]|uniref:immunity protein YezG family protein n=1 Tax=Actinopolymorpha alba TaxID=533267 RepID=UPI00037B664D|nr:immunity protein YezG family protein [Actinopolymorpha alba]